MPNVSVVKGVVRYDNIFRSLELIEKDVQDRISNSTHIVIKPDLLHINGCFGLVSVDAVKAVLDFIEEFTNKKVTIAEGSFSDEDVFHRHDYHDLLNDYSVRFLNLNNDDSVEVKLGNKTAAVSETLLKSDFRISLALLKRDRKTVLIGSIPNIVIGSVSEHDKADFYKSRTFNKDTAELFKLLKPQLSVIDGFDTPERERKLKSSLAIASSSAVAADAVAAGILKIKPGYLRYCGKAKIRVVK
ncbi:DUF362 domain-containing protein [Candidatus Woesearchaeota archaeon]|nr:DUF362 domain-containing protein [Candidatus Woesearchaeota archaeon]